MRKVKLKYEFYKHQNYVFFCVIFPLDFFLDHVWIERQKIKKQTKTQIYGKISPCTECLENWCPFGPHNRDTNVEK